jgi:hypothetical protein
MPFPKPMITFQLQLEWQHRKMMVRKLTKPIHDQSGILFAEIGELIGLYPIKQWHDNYDESDVKKGQC